jgi:hypothetical protein
MGVCRIHPLTHLTMNTEQVLEEISPLPIAKQLAPRRIQVTRLNSEMAIEPAVFVRLTPYFAEALKHCHGELSESSIKAYIAADKMQVWVALAGDGAELLGVILTECTEYPCLRVLRIVLLQGISFRDWGGHARVALEAYARENQCERLEASGRKGLTRLLAPLGFEPAYVTLIMEVRNHNGKIRRR